MRPAVFLRAALRAVAFGLLGGLAAAQAAPSITTQPASIQVTAGQPAVFSVAATGGGLTYQWQRNGFNISGATAATYTIAGASRTDADNYDVVVTSGGSSTTSQPAQLAVAPSAFPNLVAPDPAWNLQVEGTYAAMSAAVAQSNGGYYLAGSFSNVNGVAQTGVARFLPNGSLDPSFVPPNFDNVWNLVLALQSDGKLLVGGSFTHVNGAVDPWLVRLNTDGSLDSSFQPGISGGAVLGITLQANGQILICGWFWTGGNHVARLNPDGSVDASFNPGQSTNNQVSAIAVQPDGSVLIGGTFSSFNGTPSPKLARLLSSGALDTGFSLGSGFDGAVQTIAVDGAGRVLVGGAFTHYNGTAVGGIVRLSTTGALDTSFVTGSGFSAAVNTIVLDPAGNVLVGCQEASLNGTSATGSVFRLAPAGAADGSFAVLPVQSSSTGCTCIAVQPDGHLLIGGNFYQFGTANRQGFVRLTSSGQVDATTAISFRTSGYNVSSIAPLPGGRLLVGGGFSYVRGAPVTPNLVRVNADGTLDASFNAGGSGANSSIESVAVLPTGEIAIGGAFSRYNTYTASGVALLKSDGTPDTGFAAPSGGINGTVYALAVLPGGQLLVGGSFSTVGGAAMNNVALLTSTGSLASGFSPGSGTNGQVNAMAVQPDGKIILVGSFSSYNGTAVGNIVRILPSGALDPSFNPGTGADAMILCVRLQANNQVVIGGTFANVNGNSRNSLARLNADGSLDASFNPTAASGWIRAVLIQEDGNILVRGDFFELNGIPGATGLCRFTGAGSIDTSFLAGDIPAGGNNGTCAPLVMRDNGQLFTTSVSTGVLGTMAASLPAIATPPASQTVADGTSVTLSVSATSAVPVVYQWLYQGKPIAGATGSSYAISNFNGSSAGSYSVAVRSEIGTTVSAAATLTEAAPTGAASNSRLVDISTLGQVGTGANALAAGFAIAGSSKTVLIRAVGPSLAPFGVTGLLPQPLLSVYDSTSTLIASNSGWNSADAGTMATVGAFPLTPGSPDAALVTTLQPGSYSAVVTGLGSVTLGSALIEVYDVSGSGQLVNISSRLQTGGGATAGFVIGQGSGPRKLLIRGIGPGLSAYGVPDVLSDPKIAVFDGDQRNIANAVANGAVPALASATSQAGAFTASAGDAATILTLGTGAYSVQLSSNSGTSAGVGLIEVYDITTSQNTPSALASTSPVLYFASLQPATGANGSTASGYATILYDPNTNVATISVSFSNLSSNISSAHLVVGSSASSGNYVLALPLTQSNGLTWTFPATGSYSTAQLVAALQGGQLFVTIGTASNPSGELEGGFLKTAGSSTFSAPAPAPPLPAGALTSPSQTDAARFLTQATFGPTSSDLSLVMNEGISQWITDQLALPASSHLAGLRADVAAFPNPPIPASLPTQTYFYEVEDNRVAAWWKIVLTGPDQLRQRVAFALSQIFVVSASNSTLSIEQESLAQYYDVLCQDAFGNFRQLLNDVTLHPAMGLWLTYVQNQKADPFAGTSPDENYAREVQQLFTIGLVQLQPDGTLMLDETGQPIPTYDQTTISETAKVFTGWGFANVGNFLYQPPYVSTTQQPDNSGWLNPMAYFDYYHDKTQKNVVSLQQVPLIDAAPTVIPANQSGPQDLAAMLDTLFNHPNTGPFFCKQLIQRLVTSNPSPGYVYRVAKVFANDGTGTRGNLAAVVTAILTDYEARSPNVIGNAGYGKVKEPLLRASAFFRILNASAPNGRYLDGFFNDPRNGDWYPVSALADPNYFLDEEPLNAPTVFNFYSPFYTVPGPLASAGLVAPEMEITDASFAISVPNWLTNNFLYRSAPPLASPPAPSPSPFITLDFSEFLTDLAASPAALVNKINLLFCANQMSASTRTQILSYLQGPAASQPALTQVQNAIQLAIVSQDAAVQY